MTKRKRLPNVHPGEILQLDFLEPMEITVDRFSADIGVTPTSISQILNGERGITVDIALKFAGYFGNSDSPKERLRQRFWLNLQTQYDAAKTQQLYHLKAMDILDRIVPGDDDDDDDYERVPSVRRRSRIDRFEDEQNWLDDDFQESPDEWSRIDRYDAPDRSERLSSERRERAKQGRRVSDFQTIEVQYSGHLLRRKMIDRYKKSDSSLKLQVETKYKMNRSMDIVQNLLAKVGNLANRNASS